MSYLRPYIYYLLPEDFEFKNTEPPISEHGLAAILSNYSYRGQVVFRARTQTFTYSYIAVNIDDIKSGELEMVLDPMGSIRPYTIFDSVSKDKVNGL